MKKLFIFGDSYSDWCNKDIESHQNGETLKQEDFWFQKLADYKKYSLWNYGRSGYGAPGCFREFMSYIDEITEDDLVIFGFFYKPLSKNIPNGISIKLSGAASELERTWIAMKNNVLIALFVIFLLLTVLMRSFILPFVIVITVPIAGAGGVMGLVFLNQYTAQSLDMLTMLGFIILTGIVVNNSILMVEQTLWHIRYESMKISEAITEATRNRIRPIFMSTLTSLFGLIPIVIFPGSGSELYRGIGTVVFGGLSTSAILTLLMVPPLLALALKFEKVKPISQTKQEEFI